MEVRTKIKDEYFFELLKRTKAENIAKAVEIAVESFLKEEREVPSKEVEEESLLEKITEVVTEKLSNRLIEERIEEKVRKLITPKITPLKERIERAEKGLKSLEETLEELREEIKTLATEKNVRELRRRLDVLETYVEDALRELRAEIRLERLWKVLKEIEKELPVSLKIVGRKGNAFLISIESPLFKENPFTAEGLEKLLREKGIEVKVVEEEGVYRATF